MHANVFQAPHQPIRLRAGHCVSLMDNPRRVHATICLGEDEVTLFVLGPEHLLHLGNLLLDAACDMSAEEGVEPAEAVCPDYTYELGGES